MAKNGKKDKNAPGPEKAAEAELEAKVEAMMEPGSEPDAAPTESQVTGDEVITPTAPYVAEADKSAQPSQPTAITVTEHAADQAEEPPEPSVEPKQPDPEAEAIEAPAATDADKPEQPELEAEEIDAQATESEDDIAEPADEPAQADPEVDSVVDDIVAKEGDDILAAEDEKIAAAFVPPKTGFRQKLKNFFASWWQSRRARKATIGGLIVLLFALIMVPPSRYFILNTAGIRASASLMVLDDSTQQPLKNVNVKLAGKSAQTNNEGRVRLEGLRLGASDLVIEKRAFAPLNRKITIGWGSNPLKDFGITPVGSRYSFTLTDFLSGKPVEKAEATSGEANAVSDKDGKLVLTIDKSDKEEFKVNISAESYRSEELTINADDKSEHPLKLAAARKHVFISKRNGKYDVYKIDVDGKNEEIVLKGSGSEREDMILVPHPSHDVAALISTRENVRNREGYLLSTLNVIDLGSDNTASKVIQSERIQVVDWLGDRLVYVQIAAGSSASSPNRHRLMSYDYKTEDNKELATSNYFNDVLSANGQVYFAASAAYQTGGEVNFSRINADGSNKQTVLDKEVWNIFRTEYDRLSLSVQQEWYDYRLGGNKPEKASGPPVVLKTRIYMDSPDKQRSLWAEDRDGKGVLLAYDVPSKSDKVLRTQSGLKYPLRWLNNTSIIYRIHTDQETADYAMNLNGGEPVKIRDVTNTGGVDQWYYY